MNLWTIVLVMSLLAQTPECKEGKEVIFKRRLNELIQVTRECTQFTNCTNNRISRDRKARKVNLSNQTQERKEKEHTLMLL